VTEFFYVYLAGIIYFTWAMGYYRKHHPQNFFVDFLTVFLILLWPLTFAWGLLHAARTRRR